MKLDHIALRVADRHKAVNFFQSMLNYEVGAEFDIDFDDGSKAECYALIPPLLPIVLVR